MIILVYYHQHPLPSSLLLVQKKKNLTQQTLGNAVVILFYKDTTLYQHFIMLFDQSIRSSVTPLFELNINKQVYYIQFEKR